ncbi:hypothetical protein ACS0TY_029102 [Phlomoides rotata]
MVYTNGQRYTPTVNVQHLQSTFNLHINIQRRKTRKVKSSLETNLPSSRRPQSRHHLPRPSGIGIKKFIFVSAAKYCVDIAIHQHGCCVLQRCISHSTGELREKLIAEISANGLLLAQDAYGNYVVQFILELRIPSALSKLTYQFEGNYVNLSRQKFSSHVVEKCLAVCNNEDDLSAQLRSLKKCMKEAEEEQYRVSDMTSTNFSIDQMQATDSNLRFKLEQEEKMRQQEHQLLAEEQARVSTLIIQKQELEEKLASISKRTSDRGGRRGCMVFFPELFTVIKVLMQISRRNSWAEIVHSNLICMMTNMFYQVPEGRDKIGSATPLFLVDQRKLAQRSDRVKSVDLHPTEPWYASHSALSLLLWSSFVSSFLSCFRWFCDEGLSNWRTSATRVNAESSRSHSVFTCVVESRSKSATDGLTR